MFMPSARNWEEMKFEAAGCWPLPINKGDEFALVTKMPVAAIKALYRSCPLSLTVARAETLDGVVLATTLTVFDDPAAPLMLSGILRHSEEQLAVDAILHLGETLIVFFDELSRPVARAHCKLGSIECTAACTLCDTPGQRYAGSWTQLLSDVLDEVQGHSDPKLAVTGKYSPKFVTIPLTLSNFETFKMATIGIGEVLEFRLDDPDEGHGLEQSTWHLLENLFEGRIHHSPQVGDGVNRRELIDILTFCEAGLCSFETKAMAVLSTKLDRSTDRRLKSIQKQIDKAINQLVGAMKNLAGQPQLFTKKGAPLELPAEPGVIRHGIVMISEMMPDLDWESIGARLIGASGQSNAMLHVLDLQELRVLVGVSQNNPLRFVVDLIRRFEIMTERKHAMLRTKLDGPPLP